MDAEPLAIAAQELLRGRFDTCPAPKRQSATFPKGSIPYLCLRNNAHMHIQLNLAPDASHTVVADEAGTEVSIYLPESAGGAGTGIRPMQMLIMGLAGCSAIDVLMILKKQRQEVRDFRIDIDAEREPNKEPSLWQEAQLVFRVFGAVDVEKAEKAVALSMEKYCSVAATLGAAGANLTWRVEVEA